MQLLRGRRFDTENSFSYLYQLFLLELVLLFILDNLDSLIFFFSCKWFSILFFPRCLCFCDLCSVLQFCSLFSFMERKCLLSANLMGIASKFTRIELKYTTSQGRDVFSGVLHCHCCPYLWHKSLIVYRGQFMFTRHGHVISPIRYAETLKCFIFYDNWYVFYLMQEFSWSHWIWTWNVRYY